MGAEMKLSELDQRIANAVAILHHHGWTTGQVERMLDGHPTREDMADAAERAVAAILDEDCDY